ncbi:MAG TPA: electron transfer flavoprotein subunit beta/FixA family protein, partial [Planctomycetota bacterium]|nr:electron transfer flavoprotein subunit beta/FixA family protein [Planctomycetota bacterium]
LVHAFAVGVDTGVHIKDATLDARGAAKAIAAVLKNSKPDVIFCGRQAIDDDQWLFPGYLGELLGLPHASAVSSIAIAADGKSATCKRRFEDGEQTLTVALPAVITADKGVGEPRSPTLKGRLDAKKKQPAIKTAAELGVAGPDAQPALAIKQYAPPPQKTPGKVITTPPAEAAAELVKLLRNEAKII